MLWLYRKRSGLPAAIRPKTLRLRDWLAMPWLGLLRRELQVQGRLISLPLLLLLLPGMCCGSACTSWDLCAHTGLRHVWAG